MKMVRRKAMQLAAASSPSTLGELKEYLNALEAVWSVTDTKYLGAFKDQKIYLAQPDGMFQSKAYYHGGYGLVVSNKASSPAAPKGEEPIAFATCHHCAVCGEPQYTTASGITCSNGHGGASSEEDGK